MIGTVPITSAFRFWVRYLADPLVFSPIIFSLFFRDDKHSFLHLRQLFEHRLKQRSEDLKTQGMASREASCVTGSTLSRSEHSAQTAERAFWADFTFERSAAALLGVRAVVEAARSAQLAAQALRQLA